MMTDSKTGPLITGGLLGILPSGFLVFEKNLYNYLYLVLSI